MGSRKKREIITPTPLEGLFDAHTHLASTGARTAAEVTALMDRAGAAGVNWVCTVGDGLEEARSAVQASHWDERVFAAAGIHPTRANELDESTQTEITTLCGDERVVAVGECGLDWYWLDKSETCAPRDTQIEAFAWHIELAKQTGKALMIHNRDADRDVLEVLAAEGAPDTVIFHCFSSPMQTATEALDAGYVLSFAGPLTYKANEYLREVAQYCPLDRMLVETDAPYLTPMPNRGSRNEPAYVNFTARLLADLKDLPATQMAQILTDNTRRVYGIAN